MFIILKKYYFIFLHDKQEVRKLLFIFPLVIAIAKYYTLGGLSNTHLFLTVLEAEKSKINVLLINLVSGESSLPGGKWPPCCVLTR